MARCIGIPFSFIVLVKVQTVAAETAAIVDLGLIFVKTQIGANAQPARLCATERNSACVYKFWLF
jgi:hypothetical protein